ncbi:MAG: hypothetical protein MRZ65_02330 [Lachnospiraceae bacterium]|nr:hypothetical protein [Lachnospiraceae bacterium]
MNTKPLPAIIMLLAGFVTCVISIVQHFSFGKFVKIEFGVLVGFYVLGCILKIVLEKGYRLMDEPLVEFSDDDMDLELLDDTVSDEDWEW